MADLFKALSDSSESAHVSKLERLCFECTGEYPPRHQAEWVDLLSKARFSQDSILQFLNTQGFEGFEDCGELPHGMRSVGIPGFRDRLLTAEEFVDEFGVPTFTAQLIAGLERYKQEREFINAAAISAGSAERQDYSTWPSLSATARGLGLPQANYVSRLIDKHELKDNQKTGTERKVDPASIIDYCMRTGQAFNDDE